MEKNSLFTKEFYEDMFKKDIDEFYHIPKEFQTKEMCEKAFFYNKNNFYAISDEFKTKEMCETFFKDIWGNFVDVKPDKHQIVEMCVELKDIIDILKKYHKM